MWSAFTRWKQKCLCSLKLQAGGWLASQEKRDRLPRGRTPELGLEVKAYEYCVHMSKSLPERKGTSFRAESTPTEALRKLPSLASLSVRE